MPSPVGHALAGMAAGWLVVGPAAIVRSGPGARAWLWQAAAFGFVGALPDADFLIGNHSGPTHGLGSALIVGLAFRALSGAAASGGAFAAAARGTSSWRLAAAMALAYSTHTLLDWMGNDTTPPIGIMALWPFNHEYYESDLHVFMAISRRYWLPNFWTHNLTAVAWEILILAPVAAVVWLVRRRRTPSR
jgi:hypothetical protein